MNKMKVREVSRSGVLSIFSKVDEGGLTIVNESSGKEFLVERVDVMDDVLSISDFRYHTCKHLNSIGVDAPLFVSRYNKGMRRSDGTKTVFDTYKISLIEG